MSQLSIWFILNTCRLKFFPFAFHLKNGKKEHWASSTWLLFVCFEPATALWWHVFLLWKYVHCLLVHGRRCLQNRIKYIEMSKVLTKRLLPFPKIHDKNTQRVSPNLLNWGKMLTNTELRLCKTQIIITIYIFVWKSAAWPESHVTRSWGWLLAADTASLSWQPVRKSTISSLPTTGMTLEKEL